LFAAKLFRRFAQKLEDDDDEYLKKAEYFFKFEK
jgi:hypothetical protein